MFQLSCTLINGIVKIVEYTCNSMKFIIMDFEFSPLPDGKWALLAEAMLNSLLKYRPVRLQRRPLIFEKKGEITKYEPQMRDYILSFAKMSFKKKPELFENTKQHFYQGLNKLEPNLKIHVISSYLNLDGKIPIIVFWNGTRDLNLIKEMDIPNLKIFLNITTYDENNDGHFFFKLVDMDGIKVLFSTSIGVFVKNGQQMNLSETHNHLCSKLHYNVTRPHDPVTDVIYTRCIFNKIVDWIMTKSILSWIG